MKYICVSGGVISGIGKGVIGAYRCAALLEVALPLEMLIRVLDLA